MSNHWKQIDDFQERLLLHPPWLQEGTEIRRIVVGGSLTQYNLQRTVGRKITFDDNISRNSTSDATNVGESEQSTQVPPLQGTSGVESADVL